MPRENSPRNAPDVTPPVVQASCEHRMRFSIITVYRYGYAKRTPVCSQSSCYLQNTAELFDHKNHEHADDANSEDDKSKDVAGTFLRYFIFHAGTNEVFIHCACQRIEAAGHGTANMRRNEIKMKVNSSSYYFSESSTAVRINLVYFQGSIWAIWV